MGVNMSEPVSASKKIYTEQEIINRAENALLLGTDTPLKPKANPPWNGYKVAVVILTAGAVLSAIAAVVAAIFFSYIIASICAAAFLTFAVSAAFVSRIKSSEKWGDLVKKLTDKVTKLNQEVLELKTPDNRKIEESIPQPLPRKINKIEKATNDKDPQSTPSTAEIQQQIDELNAEIQLQETMHVNIPFVTSLQTLEEAYEILLATCNQRDQLLQELENKKK